MLIDGRGETIGAGAVDGWEQSGVPPRLPASSCIGTVQTAPTVTLTLNREEFVAAAAGIAAAAATARMASRNHAVRALHRR